MQTVQVGNEIPCLRLVDGALRLRLPGGMGRSEVGEDPDHMDGGWIAELVRVGRDELAPINEMQALGHRFTLSRLADALADTLPITRDQGAIEKVQAVPPLRRITVCDNDS